MGMTGRAADSARLLEWLAGLRQFGFRLFGHPVWGCFQRGEDDGGGLLDDLQALGEEGGVAMV